MAVSDPKVSIIATYQSGEGLRRVIDSLDAQTLPQEEFEVIFVDDGSPDDTFEKLQLLESNRNNVRAFRIDNSGWPSKPRNIGIDNARGEYLMFMDHDDSLFPDGLRRAYEYAVETGADLLSPKESKTNDKWWGMSSLRRGNLPNILCGDGIQHLLPLVPHKLYRRTMMLEHGIRFPEGSRVLWEDQFINVDAYRHSEVVAVMADTPVYLWHASDTNSSHTFDPARDDFWDRLDDLMSHIDKALCGSKYREARLTLLEMHLRVRVIDRMVRLLVRDDSGRGEVALQRARKLMRRFGSREVVAALPRKHQIQARFLRKGHGDLLKGFHAQDLAAEITVRIVSMKWVQGALELEAETVFGPASSDHPILRTTGDRTLLAPPADIAAKIPNRLLDVTDEVSSMSTEFIVRSRKGHVTWAIPSKVVSSEFFSSKKGLSLRVQSKLSLDIMTGAVGHPIEENIWDLFVEIDWLGMMRLKPVHYKGKPKPGLVDGRQVIPYKNNSGALSIDLAGRLRTLASDAEPVAGHAGISSSFQVPLKNLAIVGEARYAADDLRAVSEIVPEAKEAKLDSDTVERVGLDLQAEIGNATEGPALTGQLNAGPGSYRIYARRENGFQRTRHSLVIDSDAQIEWHVDS
ncbi:MAG: glycosyltransferase family 2 protein [Ancrocorticia sp.]|uniref:glycosyltransferase family 2 protein n=1 Tax=Ancrocorticia sp. TaxID=2593684 RepID=UPI003F91806A